MIGHFLAIAGSLIAYVSAVLYLGCLPWAIWRRERGDVENKTSLAARAGRVLGGYLLEIWLVAWVLIIVGDLLR